MDGKKGDSVWAMEEEGHSYIIRHVTLLSDEPLRLMYKREDFQDTASGLVRRDSYEDVYAILCFVDDKAQANRIVKKLRRWNVSLAAGMALVYEETKECKKAAQELMPVTKERLAPVHAITERWKRALDKAANVVLAAGSWDDVLAESAQSCAHSGGRSSDIMIVGGACYD